MKTCKKCDQTLPLNKYRKYISGTLYATCNYCLYEREKLCTNIDDRRLKARTYYWNNKNDIKMRRSTEEYKVQQKERAHNFYMRYKDDGLIKIWETNKRKELSDSYIKYVLVKGTDLTFKDIPESLLKLKREQLILIRKLRNHE